MIYNYKTDNISGLGLKMEYFLKISDTPFSIEILLLCQ
jgi:hypothetical protein